MILFFSATGNSLSIASMIASQTKDLLVDMGTSSKNEQFTYILRQGEDLGFVFPVIRWTTPPLVDTLLKKAHFIDENGQPIKPGYCYCVVNYGYFPGRTSQFFEKLLYKHQGLELDASYSVHSVGNCVYLAAPLEGEKRTDRLLAAQEQAEQITTSIKNKELGFRKHINPLGVMLSAATCTENKSRPTKHFHVINERCIGCGTCADICPTQTIQMKDEKPLWVNNSCTECLACLHRCPQHATQYGRSTIQRGRYINPKLP